MKQSARGPGWIGLFLMIVVVAVAAPVDTVRRLPRPALQRIMMCGKTWLSRPVADAEGNLYILWRQISGAVGNELVTSVFFQKLSADGTVAWDGTPRVPAQAMHSLADRGQAADAAGIAPDGQGGVFYLWASYLLRFDGAGRSLFPRGKMIRDQTHPLWRRPSAVRYLKNKREGVRDAELHPDGAGNALVTWRAQDSLQVNKITVDGRVLWGDAGLTLVSSTETKENGKCVGDGKGGAVALVAQGRYGQKAVIKFVSPEGRIVRTSAVLDIDLEDSNRWRMEPDGSGGIIVLYLESVHRDGDHLGYVVRLARYNAAGNRVYDLALAPLVHWKQMPKWLYLRTDRRGRALINWRNRVPGPATPTVISLARVEADGRQPWGRVLTIVKPGKEGSPYFNESGEMDMLAVGTRTHLLFELTKVHKEEETVFIRHQKVDAVGGFTRPGHGQNLTPEGGFTPFLVLLGGRAAAFWYDYRTIGVVKNQVVPVLRFMD